MKRMQLFEFEDLPWFPDGLRRCMTRMISVVHRWLGTESRVAGLVEKQMLKSGRRHIVDLCSGDGGLMVAVADRLRSGQAFQDQKLDLTLCDLYPNRTAAERINSRCDGRTEYLLEPVDASGKVPFAGSCLRTMICSFHHMPTDVASGILQSAVDARDPIFIYEISDNSAAPKQLWWVGLPLNLIFGVVVSAFTRPMTATQFCFSFIVPVLPACFAWDGAVSNARTYTPEDLEQLIEGVDGGESYEWSIERIDARPAKHLCLIGAPRTSDQS
ncbi:MAG: hypothetical protein Aurels2KO_15670 [Aureliella sp.]